MSANSNLLGTLIKQAHSMSRWRTLATLIALVAAGASFEFYRRAKHQGDVELARAHALTLLAHLDDAIAGYRVERGHLPAQLTEATAGAIQIDPLSEFTHCAQPFYYLAALGSNEYVIYSAGIDGRPGSDDDVASPKSEHSLFASRASRAVVADPPSAPPCIQID